MRRMVIGMIAALAAVAGMQTAAAAATGPAVRIVKIQCDSPGADTRTATCGWRSTGRGSVTC